MWRASTTMSTLASPFSSCTLTSRTSCSSASVHVITSVSDWFESEGSFDLSTASATVGELYYPVFINTSVAWGVMNMIGRDTRPTWEGGRGELLTASKLNEGVESYVQHLNFTFMIQVRL